MRRGRRSFTPMRAAASVMSTRGSGEMLFVMAITLPRFPAPCPAGNRDPAGSESAPHRRRTEHPYSAWPWRVASSRSSSSARRCALRAFPAPARTSSARPSGVVDSGDGPAAGTGYGRGGGGIHDDVLAALRRRTAVAGDRRAAIGGCRRAGVLDDSHAAALRQEALDALEDFHELPSRSGKFSLWQPCWVRQSASRYC